MSEPTAPQREPIRYCATCGKTRMVEWLHRDCPPDVSSPRRPRPKEPTDG